MESAEESIKAPSIPSVADSQDEDVDSCAFVLCSIDNERFEDRSVMSISIQSIWTHASDFVASRGSGFGNLERENHHRHRRVREDGL